MLARPALLLSFTVAAAGCATAVTPAPTPAPVAIASVARAESRPLPPINLVTLDGKPALLSEALAGRVALVSLWAPWCEACNEEFAALDRLEDRARARGGVVVAVAVGEKRQAVADFVGRRQMRYTQLVDEEFKLADALGQKRVPATLVVDRTGRVVFAGGALDEPALAALSAALD